MINNEFAGLNGFVWWIGVVEDRGDPLRLGRCRVRIAGWHSEKITEVPTNSLPWAQAMMPVNNPNTYTPKESDMVVGFFLDGENAQQPVIMGVLPGIPLVNSNEKTGFGDTRTSKQIDIAPAKPGEDKTSYPRYLDEPTTSRLARNEQPTQINLLNQLSSSKTNKYGVEQPPSYNARYPYNNAIETESGHAFELDDTPEYERINLMHRTGSHIEFRPEGSVQQKIMNNSTKTVGKDEVVHIKGNQLIYIDGDLTYKVGGSVTFLVEKDFAVSAKNISLSAKSNFSASAQLSASVSGYLSSSLGGLTSVITSVAGLKTTVSGKGSLDATSSGKATFGGTGTIINGATIALVNTPVAAAEGAASESANNPPAEGSPFTSPTVNPATASISSSAMDNATALYGTPTPDAGTIIGKSVSDQSYLNNVIYGPTSYNWTNASQVTQSMSVVNPSFLDSLRIDLQNGATAIKDYGVKLGSDLYTQSGIPALSQSYDKADALISTAQQTGKLADYSKAASATVDVIGKGTQVGVNITSFNRDAINASDFVKNSCLVQSGKQWVNSVTQPLQDGWDKIKEDIKETQNKIKDLDPKLKERLSELRKSIDEFDEKSLDEFINANHKDQACKYCAEEAAEKLKSEVDRKTVSDGISNCLYREYLAFKKTYASKFPITEGKATENLKKSC
jgi:hypothetical protein